jgi:HD-GYP domain-containing protein (c-di-GMP phosphodiesterase class II)
LCDSYEAMTSDRAYRSAMTPTRAQVEIITSAGTQFDPDLAEKFLGMLAAEEPESPVPTDARLAARPEDMAGWVPLGGVGPERG